MLPRLSPREVITKAGGAAGASAAGVLDPAAPPSAGGRVRITLVKLAFPELSVPIPTLDNPSQVVAPLPRSPSQGVQCASLIFDQNFHHFLTSIFGRFGVVLGCHLEVIFGTFGGQVGLPSAIL